MKVQIIKAFIKELLDNGESRERIVSQVEDKFFLPVDAIIILINHVKEDEKINNIAPNRY